MNKYCYMTLADSPSYLKEALALSYSLQQVKSKYPLFIMIPMDMIEKELLEEFKTYLPNNTYIKFILPLMYNMADNLRYNTTINKLQILSFIEYDAICFLDADMLILSNIDDYFEKPLPLYGMRKYENGLEEINGQIFILKPDYNFLALIYCSMSTFEDDEQMIDFLIRNDLFPQPKTKIYTDLDNNTPLLQDIFNHDGAWIKYFSLFSFEEIVSKMNLPREELLTAIWDSSSKRCPQGHPNINNTSYADNFVQTFQNNLIRNIFKRYE